MDKHGYLPAQGCNSCGKPLQGMGMDRPAELYAGTYTGLCYECERAPAVVLATEEDGGMTIETPPHCPAWRRDRERFYGYADCASCKGDGRHHVGRSDAQGGSYAAQCKPCFDRFMPNFVRWSKRDGRGMCDYDLIGGIKDPRAWWKKEFLRRPAAVRRQPFAKGP